MSLRHRAWPGIHGDEMVFLASVLVLVGSFIQAVVAARQLGEDMAAVERDASSSRRERRGLRWREGWEGYGWAFITLGAIVAVIATWPW